MSHSVHAHDRARVRALVDSEVEAAEQADSIDVTDYDTAHSHRSRLGGFRHLGPLSECDGVCARVRDEGQA